MVPNGDREKLLPIFKMTRIIYLNSEMSEQFLKRNDFLTYSSDLMKLDLNTLEKLKFKLEKINLDLVTSRKS